MMTRVFDLLRSLGWYLIKFIYDLIDALLSIIKKLNAFDIISSLSNNQTFIKSILLTVVEPSDSLILSIRAERR